MACARCASGSTRDGAAAPRVAAGTRLGPAVARPSKIVCIGLNFRDHAAESGMEPPAEPVLFFKATTSLAGPNDDVVIPKGASKLDWEVELAVVIGARAATSTRERRARRTSPDSCCTTTTRSARFSWSAAASG